MHAINRRELSSLSCTSHEDYFWPSVDVWIYKPHVLNKRIGAVDVVDVGKIDDEELESFIGYLRKTLNSPINVKDKEDLLGLISNFRTDFKSQNNTGSKQAFLRVLHPKDGGYHPGNVDVIIKDLIEKRVIFIKPTELSNSISPLSKPYAISLEGGCLKVYVTEDCMKDEHYLWLGNTLLPKILGWMKPELAQAPKYSQRLIPGNKYIQVYNEIKEKYFKSIQEIWTESTNPQKFIIEDIAIASYLLVLWGRKTQRFVDLGCGNGLLVHILNSEGHLGVGLDVRSRKIWNLYPKSTVLKETTISPSLDCSFPGVDWIIGNHSDELTPWIPVITANSDYETNFFLLPCCLYEFSGNKYARTCSKRTCYEEYMDYIQEICCVCGFIVERDRLKIPSTKRICFISQGRVYDESEKLSYNGKISTFVKNKINLCDTIKVRNYEEKVKNCTQLEKKFLEDIVMRVSRYIMDTCKKSNEWNEGEFKELKDIIELLSSEERNTLKNECGGLQTLLKNHHHVFLVANGKVKLRKPTFRNVPSHLQKKKECWFFKNHPDSCPLLEEQCSFIHSR